MARLSSPRIITTHNAIMDILGTTTVSFYPFYETTGTVVSPAPGAVVLTSSDEAGTVALEAEFTPLAHNGGIHSYHFQQAGNQHLAAADDASHSFGNATVDVPFSVGAWVLPNDVTTVSIMAKYNGAGTVREWAWRIGASSNLLLELFDESANASEIGTSTGTVTAGDWVFLVTTYDGDEVAPVVTHYFNAVPDATTSTTETATYTAMENTATPLLVAASGVTGTPAEEFQGRIALPFIVGGELTAQNVIDLYGLTADLMDV